MGEKTLHLPVAFGGMVFEAICKALRLLLGQSFDSGESGERIPNLTVSAG
jgi:hypothetical protein